MGIGILGQAFVHCAAIMFEGMEVLCGGLGSIGVARLGEEEGLRWLFGIVADDIGDFMMIWVGI